MYHPTLIALARARVEPTLRTALPGGLREYSLSEVAEFRARFADLHHPKTGEPQRPLAKDEHAFILNERVMCKLAYRYFAERYWTINIAGQALAPLYPLWETQELVLGRIADLQWARHESGHPDGIVFDLLKDRQMGGSTLMSSLLGHRVTTHAHINGLLASDEPDNSAFLYDMFERGVDNLPFYLKPTITERVKNDEMVFATDSRLMVSASKSTRGADSTLSGASKRGQLGRGKTLSVVHLSELATYTNPSQVDTALDPAIPRSPFTLWGKESSAQGRGKNNWWYQDWQVMKSGKGRGIAIFIGWYLEKSRHHLPPPPNWTPSQDTLAHARKIEETSPRWLKGRVYHPTVEQLCWYEHARAEAVAKDNLEGFLQEHPADDEEAFQFSGKSVVSVLVRERIKSQARPMVGMVEVRTNRELGTAF